MRAILAIRKFIGNLRKLGTGKSGDNKQNNGAAGKGILVFANTSEVIAAERILKEKGLKVEVKGPPPNLQTGCDMILVFPVLQQAVVVNALKNASREPQQIIAASDVLLEPVSLFHIKELDKWVMVRAANMKITVDRNSGEIVNISGGGCPDVPWLARELTGRTIFSAPEPISMGRTLCCYSLQKAFEEMKRILRCG